MNVMNEVSSLQCHMILQSFCC